MSRAFTHKSTYATIIVKPMADDVVLPWWAPYLAWWSKPIIAVARAIYVPYVTGWLTSMLWDVHWWIRGKTTTPFQRNEEYKQMGRDTEKAIRARMKRAQGIFDASFGGKK